ncbi:MAG TPA: efflux RND transporter permease subunit [Chloroflexota bacterium]|nr:efflux RND transporter permease subunit [Chloroflexota bacterium]
MGGISRFALRNPLVVVLVLVLVAASGVYSAISLRQEAFPDISLPVVTITTSYSGASASVVLDSVTRPLEAAVSGVSGIQALDSTSADGLSRVLVTFDVGSDTRSLQRQVQDAVNGVTLPSGVTRPQVTLNGPNSRPIMTYSLGGSDVVGLTTYAQNTIIPALQGLDGVAGVTVLGGAARDVLVNADPAQLKRYGVSILTLDNALRAGTASQPVGSVTIGGLGYPVTAGSGPADLAAIRALPLVSAATGAGGGLAAGAGGGGTGSTSSVTATSSVSQSIQQAAGYLTAARAELLSFSGGIQPNAFQPIGGGPTSGAQADIFEALNIIQTDPSGAAQNVRYAERNLTERVLKKHPDYAQNPHFSNALSWLQLAGTALALGGTGAHTLTVGDVATVTLGIPAGGPIVHSNGRSGVLLQITRTDTADTSKVAAAVRQKLAGLSLPSGFSLSKVSDISDTIATSIQGAVREGAVGALLAVLIIGLFLRNWRATLIATVSIPFSFLLTMIVLEWLGLTLNVITLAGVAVATGRVVDDSIVVIENLYRRIARGEIVTRATVLAGVTDVGAAILSSTATTICVFLPLAFVSGIVTTFFAPFAWTVTIHLVASYLCAVTIVPLMAYALFSRGRTPREAEENALTRAYRRTLAWSLDHRMVVLAAAVLTVLAALAILRRTPSDLIPQTGPATATVNLSAPLGSTVETTSNIASHIERAIVTDNDVLSYYTTIGDVNRRGVFVANSRIVQNNQGTIYVNFKDGVDGTAATDRLRRLLGTSSNGASLEIHKVGDASSSLELDVTGSNADSIATVTRQVEDIVRGVGSVDALTDTLAAARPALQVQIDPNTAARYGLTPSSVTSQLQALVNGATVSHITLDGVATDIVAGLSSAAMTSTADLGTLPLSSNNGIIPLSQVARITPIKSVALVTRHNQLLAARVTGVITSANVGGVSRSIQRKVDALSLPGDTKVTLAGVSQQQSVAFGNVYNSMIVAVILVFIVMVLAFRTLASPVAILFSLPVTLIGAALGLALGRQPLGLPALIGFLMLIGIVVTNAIVLMTRVQQYREAGASTRAALIDAGVNRLRPILMTAVATIVALVPLSLGLAEGNLVSQSLADTVIGGLISSTLLTLLVVPVAFSFLVPNAPLEPPLEAEQEPVLVAASRS